MNKYICVHGHFYQPPRENPWLNEVEMQESAHPFHDWNERITDECYARNSASRILNSEGAIVDIMNNYSRISFNFGPTLLEWMEKKAPDTYQAILDADKESQKRFSGHGSAIAQVYNHLIMPLANLRDKHTQVYWGKHDFKKRFGRDPEGMWLGETAADTETLEVLAEHGIKFTILSPYQANRYRRIGEKEWIDGTGARIDPRRPYQCNLPSGRSIVLFFYDGPVSQGIAFEGLLGNGERLANRLMGNFDEHPREPQLMHIATDGETYGHHHRFGEMALSYALERIEKDRYAELTVYGEYVEKFPPTHEAYITENTSWSCAHGVERWRSNCGCNTGGNGSWNQEWRGPIRAAFDWVRDELSILFEREMTKLGLDPWKARNAYIQVIMDRSEENVEQFFRSQTKRKLLLEEKKRLLKLLEMQYHTLLMYTSCGWFFDEVTGIETVQDIFYAARAIQLGNELSGTDYETPFALLLEKAKSNVREERDAGFTYNRFVKPTILNLFRVGAHYAVASLFAKDPEKLNLYSFQATSERYELLGAGRQKLAIGKAHIKSDVTWEDVNITFGVLHLGDHQLLGGVREYVSPEAFEVLYEELTSAFNRGIVNEIILLLDKHFQSHNYSFWHLFKDDQNKILNKVLQNTLQGVESDFQQVYDSNYPVMIAINTLGLRLPPPLKLTVEYIVNSRLQRELSTNELEVREVKRLFEEANRMNIVLNVEVLAFEASQRVDQLVAQLEQTPLDISLMQKLIELLRIIKKSPLKTDYWQAQNIAFRLNNTVYRELKKNSKEGDFDTIKSCDKFEELYNHLNMKA